MKKTSKPKRTSKSRSSSRFGSKTPTKSMMIIVSLIGGGIAWLLSQNPALGLTVFAAIGLGNWLVYHKGLSV